MAENEEINRVGIELYIEDKTAEGLAHAEKSVQQQVTQIGYATDASAKFSQALDNGISKSAMKASQATYEAEASTSKFGNALNNATNTSGLAAKGINQLIGMFNPFTLAIGGVIAGLGFLASKLDEMTQKQFYQYYEKIKQITEQTKEFTNATLAAMDRQVALNEGVTESHLDAYEAGKKRGAIMIMLGKAEEELAKNEKRQILDRGLGWEMFTGKIADENKERRETIVQMKEEIRKLDEIISRKKIAGAEEISLRGAPELVSLQGPAKTKEAGGQLSLDAQYSPMIERIKSIANWWSEARDEMQAYDEMQAVTMAAIKGGEEMYASSEEETMRRIIAANQLKYETSLALERALAEERQANVQKMVNTTMQVGGAIGTIVQTVGKVMSAAIKDEKKRMKATAAVTAILESIAAAVEIAKAIGSYPDVVGMAAHAASAAAHIVAAVLAAKYGGGGATAPSKSAGGSAAAGGAVAPAAEEVKATTTIVVQGHIFSPEGGAGFVQQAFEAGQNQRNPGRERTEM